MKHDSTTCHWNEISKHVLKKKKKLKAQPSYDKYICTFILHTVTQMVTINCLQHSSHTSEPNAAQWNVCSFTRSDYHNFRFCNTAVLATLISWCAGHSVWHLLRDNKKHSISFAISLPIQHYTTNNILAYTSKKYWKQLEVYTYLATDHERWH